MSVAFRHVNDESLTSEWKRALRLYSRNDGFRVRFRECTLAFTNLLLKIKNCGFSCDLTDEHVQETRISRENKGVL
jgi:hypothetical protein